MEPTSQPYLSFVIAARNDNYGGNFLHRLQLFINALFALWSEYNLDAELVIVEWNPPADRFRLKDAIIWPQCWKRGLVRIIEVSSDLHQRLPNSDKMPMFEYIAKNVGIHRAKGAYVLSTNPDLLYNEVLIKFLASKRLSSDFFYRVDRYDIDELPPFDFSVREQLKFCSEHAFRVATVNGTIPIERFSHRLRYNIHSFLSDTQKLLVSNDNIYFLLRQLHTNASGDFFLMASQHWHALRGYPEFKSHSFIDGYACYLAASSGLRQIILKDPLRIYHQEHDRSEHAKRPLTDYQEYYRRGKRMLEAGRPDIINSEDWGLGKEQLPEWEIEL